MNKIKRIIDKLTDAGDEGVQEIDLFNDFERSGAVRVTKHRVRKTLKTGQTLVVKGGVWFLQRTGGVAGFAIMAILVVVMSILSFNAGRVDTVAQCERILHVNLITEEDYLNE